MSDDLVKRLRAIAVHSYLGRSVIEEAADRIYALTADRDRLRGALRDIARQKKPDEMDTEYDVECADFEGGYNAIIDVARRALPAVQPGHVNETPKSEHDERVMLTLTAERDRLREALNQSRLAFAGHVSVQSAIDLIDRAALKGETP